MARGLRWFVAYPVGQGFVDLTLLRTSILPSTILSVPLPAATGRCGFAVVRLARVGSGHFFAVELFGVAICWHFTFCICLVYARFFLHVLLHVCAPLPFVSAHCGGLSVHRFPRHRPLVSLRFTPLFSTTRSRALNFGRATRCDSLCSLLRVASSRPSLRHFFFSLKHGVSGLLMTRG